VLKAVGVELAVLAERFKTAWLGAFEKPFRVVGGQMFLQILSQTECLAANTAIVALCGVSAEVAIT